jgi:hypothetical protein
MRGAPQAPARARHNVSHNPATCGGCPCDLEPYGVNWQVPNFRLVSLRLRNQETAIPLPPSPHPSRLSDKLLFPPPVAFHLLLPSPPSHCVLRVSSYHSCRLHLELTTRATQARKKLTRTPYSYSYRARATVYASSPSSFIRFSSLSCISPALSIDTCRILRTGVLLRVLTD